MPSPVRPRETQSRVPDFHSKREAEAEVHRSALKDAIEQARVEKNLTPAKSPLELMREKSAAKPRAPEQNQNRLQNQNQHQFKSQQNNRPSQQQKPRDWEPAHGAPESPRPHTQRASTPDKKPDEAPPRAPERAAERPHTEHRSTSHHNGEVSHRELQRVLNGTERDSDDL